VGESVYVYDPPRSAHLRKCNARCRTARRASWRISCIVTLIECEPCGHRAASGRVLSLAAIARREHLAKRYVARLNEIEVYTPSIVEAIVEGRAPAAPNLRMLMDNRVRLPLGWKDQERLLKLQQ
jgi:hypothetical protein